MSRASTSLPPVRLILEGADACDLTEIPQSLAKAIRSVGYEVVRLRSAARILASRVNNETLPPPLVAFLKAGSAAAVPSPIEPERFSLKLGVSGSGIRLEVPSAFTEWPVYPETLALFHLPALRGFWERELRRSHFARLRHVLPKAWFVTSDPPVGSVIPDLGLSSWPQLKDDHAFTRLVRPGGEIVIERASPPEMMMTATYERARQAAA